MDKLLGEILSDRWWLRDIVGRGATGTVVFRAEDVLSGERARVKLVGADLVRDQDVFESARAQASAAGKSGLPVTPRFFDAGRVRKDAWYLAHEFLEGETLARLLDRQAIIPYKEVFSIIHPVCVALDVLHGAGLIHGDIKPENILVCREDGPAASVKLLDFGMARIWESQEGRGGGPSGASLAPIDFLSPQQIRKGQAVDARADVYALGVIMYKAIVGKAPFEAETADAVKTRILAGRAREPHRVRGDLPEDVGLLIMRAMDKDPARRISSAGKLAIMIEDVGNMPQLAGDAAPETSGPPVELKEVVEGAPDEPPPLPAGGLDGAGQDEWQVIIDELRETLYSSGDQAERMKAGKDLATMYENVFGDLEKAREVLVILMMIDPRDRQILDAMDRICTKSSDWLSLVEILDRKIDGEKRITAKADLLARQGEIYHEHLNDPERAAKAFRHVTDELRIPNPRALRGLARIYGQMDRWQEVVETLYKLIPVSDSESRAEVYEDIATVCVEKLRSPARAREALDRLLKIQPDNERALYLMQAVESTGQEADEDEPTGQIDLNRINPAASIQTYQARLGAENDLKKRSRLLRQMARIYEEGLGDPVSAYQQVKRAYFENAADPKVFAELERLAGKNNRWGELIGAVTEEIARIGDRTAAVPLYLHAGKWTIEHLGQLQRALPMYTKVLQIDPDNAEAHGVVADMYRVSGQWKSYVHYLKVQADKTRRKETRTALLAKLGTSYKDDFRSMDLAMETLRKVLELDPFNEEALDGLEDIYAGKEMYRELTDVIDRKIERLGPEADKEKLKELHLYEAKIYESILDDLAAAVRSYQKAVEADPDDMEVLRGLEGLYARMKHTHDLIDVLDMQMRAAREDGEKIELLTRSAALLEKDVVKPELAAEKYEQILAIDPGNVEALENLQRLYSGMKEWGLLVSAIDTHVLSSEDREKKISLLFSACQILMKELKDRPKAVEYCRKILGLDGSNREAIGTLASLFEEMENYEEAYEALEQIEETTQDPREKADLFARMGKLLSGRLGRREEAAAKLEEGLAVMPEHLECLGALRTIYVETNQWEPAFGVLEAEARATASPHQKSELLYAQGRILADYLGRADDAIPYFRKAVEVYPDNDEAAMPLADHEIGKENWQEALGLLEMIVRKGAGKPAAEIVPWYLKLGYVALVLEEHEKTLAAYKGAYDIDQTSLEAVKGLAHTFYRMERWGEAFKYFQMMVFKFPEQLPEREKADVYFYLGSCKLSMKDTRKGVQLLETLLESESHHRMTLETLIAFYERLKDWKKVIHYKQLLSEVAMADERFNLLLEIGELWQEKLGVTSKAIAVLIDALRYRPNDRGLHHRLATLYSLTKQWTSAVEILERTAALEEDPGRKSRYYHSIAVIFQSEVKDIYAAVDYLNRALDADPDNLKEFEAIERLLTPIRDWGALEASYLKMIERVSGKGKTALEISLLHNLGEIYRTRMKNFQAAAAAFKRAVDLDPADLDGREILAELLRLIPDRLEEAAAQHHYLVEQDPERVESLRALQSIYYEAGQFDRAWCVCGVLCHMRQANEEEKDFYHHYRTEGPVQFQRTVDAATWAGALVHPEENLLVGKIFEVITPIVFKAKAQLAQVSKAYDLRKKDRRNPDSDKDFITAAFAFASRVLALPLPEIYASQRYQTGLQYAFTDPEATLIGKDLLSGRYTRSEILFLVAKHLTYYRPEHYIRVVEPAMASLGVLFHAAVKLVLPDFPVDPAAAPQTAAALEILRMQLLPDQAQRLSEAVKAFADSKACVDLPRWVQGVELTANRAGFLLCNDLDAAVTMQSSQATGISDAPLKKKVTDLKLFAISESYFHLRRQLGLSIKM
jgi:tetratricopeptide (TPR) repeat protein/serine/threonine protein kinase